MKSARSPRPSLKTQLIRGGVGLLLGGALLGATLLHEQASRDAVARKSAVARAFEAAPERWLAHPADVSEFERALAARELSAVGVDGTLLLYTDKRGNPHNTRLIDCGPACGPGLAARLPELSASNGFALASVVIDERTPIEKFAPHSPASARASSVLPVPGGPSSSTPRGARAPTAVYCAGSFMKAATRCNDFFASSAPITSAKQVSGFSASGVRPAPSVPLR